MLKDISGKNLLKNSAERCLVHEVNTLLIHVEHVEFKAKTENSMRRASGKSDT